MSKRLKVLLIILGVVVLAAVGDFIYLKYSGAISSEASTLETNCPPECPDSDGSIDVTVKYNNSLTKYPIRIRATSEDCNGPNISGTRFCSKNCDLIKGSCTIQVCKGNSEKGWSTYRVYGKYSIPNTGKYIETSYRTIVNYGSVNTADLTAECKRSSDNTPVACP